MDNIRLSFNVMKMAGTRLLNCKDNSGKDKIYVSIPIEHFFVPGSDPKPYLLCSMIPCPNAQYGDFMIKPFISGADWEQMSEEDRRNVPVIGKGTFMRPAVNKAVKNNSEKAEVEEVNLANLTPTDKQGTDSGSAATLNSANFPAGGGTTNPSLPLTRFDIFDDNGSISWTDSWSNAAEFASQASATRRKIQFVNDGKVTSQWRWDEARITWIQDF